MTVDYAALAAKHGGVTLQDAHDSMGPGDAPATEEQFMGGAATPDYAALAAKHGGVSEDDQHDTSEVSPTILDRLNKPYGHKGREQSALDRMFTPGLAKATTEYIKSKQVSEESPVQDVLKNTGNDVLGIGEAGLNAITGLGHTIYSGIKGAATAAATTAAAVDTEISDGIKSGKGITHDILGRLGRAIDAGAEAGTAAINETSSDLTYEPRTAGGKLLQAAVRAPFVALSEHLGKTGRMIGSVVGPKTAAALESIGEAAPPIAAMLLGLRTLEGKDVPLSKSELKMRQDSFLRGHDAGLRVIPADIQPTIARGVLASINKITKAEDELSRKNASVRAQLIRQDFPQLDQNLKEGEDRPGEIHPDEMNEVIANEYEKGYAPLKWNLPKVEVKRETVGKINNLVDRISGVKTRYPNLSSGPTHAELSRMAEDITKTHQMDINDVLTNITDLRQDAKSYGSSPTGQELSVRNQKMAQFHIQLANELENVVEANLPEGSPLLENYRNSRRQIAKAHDVLATLDPSTGEVVGQKVAKLFNNENKRKVLTGNLALVAEHAAAFKRVHKNVAAMPAGSPLNPWDFILAGGALTTGHYGMAAGEILGRLGASKITASDWLQEETADTLRKSKSAEPLSMTTSPWKDPKLTPGKDATGQVDAYKTEEARREAESAAARGASMTVQPDAPSVNTSEVDSLNRLPMRSAAP